VSASPAASSESGVASTQRAAVVTALVANVVVAVAKLAAFFVTGSSALLAEALHSAADSTNEILLLVGARRSAEPADRDHPFGHIRYRYLYAFIVSLTVFWIGGVLAVIEGLNHLANPEPILDSRWAFAVLALGALVDGWSLRTTIRAGRSARGAMSWKQLIRVTKAPELIVVFLEDIGALLGITIAVIGVALTTITGAVVFDAAASIAIGLLLMAIGRIVNGETESLLLGESATADVEARVRDAIAGTTGIEGLVDFRTIHPGPDDLFIASGIVVDPGASVAAVTGAVVEAKARVRAAVPLRTTIYLEPRSAPDSNDARGS
jgi:cation diffusion facilitator family transporter